MTNDIETRLRASAPPEPPAWLRERVLAGATPQVCRRAGHLERLWFSRAWRLVLAAALGLLFIADALSAPELPGPTPAAPLAVSTTFTMGIDAGLSPDDAAAIAEQARPGRTEGS